MRPSKYDDEAYVVRHRRGLVASNTLACLAGLTRDVQQRKALATTTILVRLYDEVVERVPVSAITRRAARERDTRTIVCLVGVQSCLFSRAVDLADQFRAAGVAVLIGGFHVSGMMATAPNMPADIQRLLDMGVTIVLGEVEHRWESILRDAARGSLRPVYDFLAEPPCLDDAPTPRVDSRHLKRFALSKTATIDTSRGCPFNCSFCTIISVQGRTIRARSVDAIAAILRRNYRRHGIARYFFTDDNFARNPNAMAIFGRLRRMRAEERIPVEFMIQADVAAHRIPGFVEQAAAAGCHGVFIGIESLNPRNLAAAGKTQNQSRLFRGAMDAWRRAGIFTQAAYIIGFPHDTVRSVREDLRRLREEIRPDMASFFIPTPLPGSRDHRRMQETGQWMHPDLNRYDCQHITTRHPHLSDTEWEGLYGEAWQSFYAPDNLKRILRRVHPRAYWPLFNLLFWYRWAALCEGEHPMLAGILRLKDRKARRPGTAVEGLPTHLRRRAKDVWRNVRDVARLFVEMEDLWLQTRPWMPADYRAAETGGPFSQDAADRPALEALREQFQASRRQPGRRWAWPWCRWAAASTRRIHSRRDLTQRRPGIRRWAVLAPLRATLNVLRKIHLALCFISAIAAQA